MDGRTVRAQKAREARRSQILEGALEVFADKGYHEATVRDVVRAAGVARGTFYLYFDSKEAIFHELLDDLLAHLRGNVVGVDTRPGAPPVPQQLLGTVMRLLSTVDESRPLVRVLLRTAVGLDARADEKLGEFYGNLLHFIEAALVQGQRMGIVRELDVEIAAAGILGSIKQVLERYLVATDEPIDATRIASGILDLNLRGVLTA